MVELSFQIDDVCSFIVSLLFSFFLLSDTQCPEYKRTPVWLYKVGSDHIILPSPSILHRNERYCVTLSNVALRFVLTGPLSPGRRLARYSEINTWQRDNHRATRPPPKKLRAGGFPQSHLLSADTSVLHLCTRTYFLLYVVQLGTFIWPWHWLTQNRLKQNVLCFSLSLQHLVSAENTTRLSPPRKITASNVCSSS